VSELSDLLDAAEALAARGEPMAMATIVATRGSTYRRAGARLLVPAEGELLTLSLAYVEASRSVNSGIALRPGLRVASITSSPLWNVNPSDQAVVPATEQIDFSVVITNAGNVVSEPERIDLTLGGASDPLVLTETVPPLEPGEQTAIQFLEIPIVAGGVYEVVASLPELANDIDLEDNVLTVMFEVNEEG